MQPKLSKEEITDLFLNYKSNKEITTEQLARLSRVDRTTIGNYFRKFFNEEYKLLIPQKKSKNHSEETKKKLSLLLKGKPKPQRTQEHRNNLSKSLSRNYIERFGEKRAAEIKEKISKSHKGQKRNFRDKENWKKNLSNSLKGRAVWNKGKKGLQKAWNKKELSEKEIIEMYQNKNLSSIKIANYFKVSRYTIIRILKSNSISIKGFGGFHKGKKLNEILGEEKAKIKSQKISNKLKGKKCNHKEKISKSLKEYYKQNPVSNEKREKQSKISKQMWQDSNYREKLIKKHKEYLFKHPEELERLRKIQYPGNISKIENKVLNFLRQHFKENEDFLFDQQDLSGKTFYRPDFQFPKQKIIIELYGYYKHFTKDGKQKDKIREYYLRKAGWKVYKFNFLEIEREYKFKEIKEKILKILKNEFCLWVG